MPRNSTLSATSSQPSPLSFGPQVGKVASAPQPRPSSLTNRVTADQPRGARCCCDLLARLRELFRALKHFFSPAPAPESPRLSKSKATERQRPAAAAEPQADDLEAEASQEPSLARLRGVGEKELQGQLHKMGWEELAQLARTGPQGRAGPPELAQAIKSEIAGRPQRLAQSLLDETNRLIASYNCDSKFPGNIDAHLQELSGLVALKTDLLNHCAAHGLQPPSHLKDSSGQRESLVERVPHLIKHVASAVKAGRIDCRQLSEGQACALAINTFALGGIDAVPDELHAWKERFGSLQGQLMAVLEGLAAKTGPEALLRSLAHLEQAAGALERALSLFSAKGTDPAETARRVQDALVEECLASVSAEDASALAKALRELPNQALIAALRSGADVASEAHERPMSERLASMARVLEQVRARMGVEAPAEMAAPTPTAAAAKAKGSAPAAPKGQASRAKAAADPARRAGGSSATPPVPAHHQFAATHLSEEARKTFRHTYALTFPPQGSPLLRSGRLAPAQTERMKGILESPLSNEESKQVPVGGYPIGEQFRLDVNRKAWYRVILPPAAGEAGGMTPLSGVAGTDAAPAGKLLFDYENWPNDPQEQEGRIAAGYAQLLELCGGDEKRATQLTLYGHQGLAAGFLAALSTGDVPLALPDGTRGIVQPSQDSQSLTEITFSIGEHGRPQIDLDYRLSGRMFFSALPPESPDMPVGPDAGQMRYLTPQSHVEGHFRAELQEDGTLVLLEPPAYQFDLEKDERQFPFPTLDLLLTEGEDSELVHGVLAYAKGLHKSHEVRALRALHAFEASPTKERAAAVLRALDDAPEADYFALVSADRREAAIRQWLDSTAEAPPSPQLFPKLRQKLTARIERELLPGMIEVMQRGKT